MTESADDLTALAQRLAQSDEYRVLRRLAPRTTFAAAPSAEPVRIGLLLDVETTGLDTRTAEVIELGMVKFCYLPDGQITEIVGAFSCLNEPYSPISEEITAITHITNEMVAGQRIDAADVSAFIDGANVIIAHNANFDRRFAERYWPEFEHKPWGCSVTEIDWRVHGFAGSRLAYLLMGAGYFHQAHRAVDDCHALLEILAMPLGQTGQSALAALLTKARRKTVRIWAEGAPFDLKDHLKSRGYRWSDGSDGRPRSWFIEIDETLADNEIHYLKQEIYRQEIDLFVQKLSATSRYSGR